LWQISSTEMWKEGERAKKQKMAKEEEEGEEEWDETIIFGLVELPTILGVGSCRNQNGKVEYIACGMLTPSSALTPRWPFTLLIAGVRMALLRTSHPSGSRRIIMTCTPSPTVLRCRFELNRKIFQKVGIHSKEKTHSNRKQSVLSGAPEAQIRPPEHGSDDGCLPQLRTALPCAFMRSIAGFPKEGKGYFLPCTQEMPGEALCSKVWPEADKLVERMESYHPDKADNDILAGSGFPRLLRDSGPRA
jgi:hypothetical protein